jgi:hypothetical protein
MIRRLRDVEDHSLAEHRSFALDCSLEPHAHCIATLLMSDPRYTRKNSTINQSAEASIMRAVLTVGDTGVTLYGVQRR